MDAWLTAAADKLTESFGVSRDRLEIQPYDEQALLTVARVASHQSGARTNAPLLCYMLGFTAAQVGIDIQRLALLFPE
jgi:hypothetical protein